MILDRIQKMLSRRLSRKKQDVIRLRWQQIQLQQQLEQIKRQQSRDARMALK